MEIIRQRIKNMIENPSEELKSLQDEELHKSYVGLDMSGGRDSMKGVLTNFKIISELEDKIIKSDGESYKLVIPIFHKGSGKIIRITTFAPEDTVVLVDDINGWTTEDILFKIASIRLGFPKKEQGRFIGVTKE